MLQYLMLQLSSCFTMLCCTCVDFDLSEITLLSTALFNVALCDAALFRYCTVYFAFFNVECSILHILLFAVPLVAAAIVVASQVNFALFWYCTFRCIIVLKLHYINFALVVVSLLCIVPLFHYLTLRYFNIVLLF